MTRDRFGRFRKKGTEWRAFLPPCFNQNRGKNGRFVKGRHPFKWAGRAGYGIMLPAGTIKINND